MPMIDLDLLSFSEEDNIVFGQIRLDTIGSEDLTKHFHFRNAENVFKLISCLSIARRYDQIEQILNRNVDDIDIFNNGQLELILSCLFEKVDIDYSKVSGEVRTCIDYFISKDANQSKGCLPDRKVDLLCRIRTLQYLILDGKTNKAEALLNSLDSVEKRVMARHFGTWLIFITEKLQRIRPHANFAPWRKLAYFLKENIHGISLDELSWLTLAIAQIETKMDNLDEALKKVRSLGKVDKKMETSLLIRKSLLEKDYRKSVFFSDKFILMSDVKVENELVFDRELAEQVLVDINDTLRNAGLKPFIMSGTLLGCIREKRIFEHDKDFDIGIIGWEAQFDVANALLKSDRFSLNLKNLTGKDLGMLPAMHINSGFSFDIFFFHDKGDHFLHAIDSRTGYSIYLKNSKFGLIEHEFLGSKFFIPDQYERKLTEHYGSDWRVPNPNYFVTIESPALVKKTGHLYAFTLRHEMLKLMNSNASLEKAKSLVSVIKQNAQKADQPKEKILKHFIECFERADKNS